jgi:hypothetical protein
MALFFSVQHLGLDALKRARGRTVSSVSPKIGHDEAHA